MIRLLLLALGLLLGYTARQPPLCERTHLPRHLDPAIVDREGDDGILPPDPRTATTTLPTWTMTSAPPTTATWRSAPDLRLWPETLEHEGEHLPALRQRPGCRRCDAEWWLHHRGARPA